jgi:hypothetical protein
MVNLKRCRDVIEAETLRIRLASAGIHAVVQGGQTATTLSYVGSAVGYPQVEVADDDYQSALAILESDRVALETAGKWICSRCDEQNEPSFDICWSCNKTRGPDDIGGVLDRERAEGSDDDDESSGESASPFAINGFRQKEVAGDNGNPYRPLDWQGAGPAVWARKNDSETAEEDLKTIDRAFNAAVCGLFLPILLVLNLYSIYLLLRVSFSASHTRPPRPAKWYAAWAINGIVVVIVSIVLRAGSVF